MNRKSGTGSGLFLMEMIMVVCFFLICASVCILVFVKSNQMSRLAMDTNQSVIMSESLAESFKVGKLEDTVVSMRGVMTGNDNYEVYWDSSWECAEKNGEDAYRAEVSLSEDSQMQEARIVIVRIEDGKELNELNVKRYTPAG